MNSLNVSFFPCCPLAIDERTSFIVLRTFFIYRGVSQEENAVYPRYVSARAAGGYWRRRRHSPISATSILGPLFSAPLVVGRKNLGGEKICRAVGVAVCFECCCDKLCGFQNLEQSLKTTHFFRLWCGSLPMKKATLFLPSSKYRRLSSSNKFDSWMDLKLFDG